MNYGLHIIKNPAGTYSYVGTIPAALGVEKPAARADVMAGRSYQRDGVSWVIRFPVFTSHADAVKHAEENGVSV